MGQYCLTGIAGSRRLGLFGVLPRTSTHRPSGTRVAHLRRGCPASRRQIRKILHPFPGQRYALRMNFVRRRVSSCTDFPSPLIYRWHQATGSALSARRLRNFVYKVWTSRTGLGHPSSHARHLHPGALADRRSPAASSQLYATVVNGSFVRVDSCDRQFACPSQLEHGTAHGVVHRNKNPWPGFGMLCIPQAFLSNCGSQRNNPHREATSSHEGVPRGFFRPGTVASLGYLYPTDRRRPGMEKSDVEATVVRVFRDVRRYVDSDCRHASLHALRAHASLTRYSVPPLGTPYGIARCVRIGGRQTIHPHRVKWLTAARVGNTRKGVPVLFTTSFFRATGSRTLDAYTTSLTFVMSACLA